MRRTGEIGGRLSQLPGVSLVAEGSLPAEGTRRVHPRLLSIAADELTADATEECFGPLTIIARYDSDTELRTALDRLPASLTGAIHAELRDGDADIPRCVDGRLELPR